MNLAFSPFVCKLGIQSWQVKVCALLLVSFLFVTNRSIKTEKTKSLK